MCIPRWALHCQSSVSALLLLCRYTHLVRFLELFLSALYQLPLKWEKSPRGYVTWCESSIHMVKNTPTFLMKGVKWQPLSHTFPLVGDFQLWDKWVDASSSNVDFALKSRVPTLVGKAATFSSSTLARMVNLRSIVMGFGYKKYKWKWWWRPLVNTLCSVGFKIVQACRRSRGGSH